MEMLAKLYNCGPFHLFFTLSGGDMRSNKNFVSILIEKGWKIIFHEQTQDTTVNEVVEVELKDGSIKPLESFLKEDADEIIHEMIRLNVLTATRNFVHRVRSFKTEIMMRTNNPLNIHKFIWMVEYQGGWSYPWNTVVQPQKS